MEPQGQAKVKSSPSRGGGSLELQGGCHVHSASSHRDRGGLLRSAEAGMGVDFGS